MDTLSDFGRYVRSEFSFLEELGFRETAHSDAPDDSYAEVVFEGAATELKVWLDGRGEVDADLRRVALAEQWLPIYRFDRGHDPNRGVRPAFAFGWVEGTSLRTAVNLLAAFIRNEAIDALQGDADAWERAAKWNQPRARLP
jgi:hypothetical protein